MNATAVLSKSSSQQVGGSSVGGLMTTAMSNKDGEIVVPVLVTGTIPSPKVSPDMNAMAKMKASNLLPSFSNPQQMTQGALGQLGRGAGGIMGAGSGKTQPGAAASNQQQPSGNTSQDAVKELEGLFGKKNPKK
jgi:hypothetical protein